MRRKQLHRSHRPVAPLARAVVRATLREGLLASGLITRLLFAKYQSIARDGNRKKSLRRRLQPRQSE